MESWYWCKMMNIWDILIIVLLAAVVVFAAVRIVKNRKKGKCSCGCANCAGCAAMQQGKETDEGI